MKTEEVFVEGRFFRLLDDHVVTGGERVRIPTVEELAMRGWWALREQLREAVEDQDQSLARELAGCDAELAEARATVKELERARLRIDGLQRIAPLQRERLRQAAKLAAARAGIQE